LAALRNPKCSPEDITVLKQALVRYEQWVKEVSQVESTGRQQVVEVTSLLNKYKDDLEVELIAKSDFLLTRASMSA
jgi:hypothetical protein